MSRILVVEDEKHLADGLRFNLEAENYEVELTDTGEAALDMLMTAPFSSYALSRKIMGAVSSPKVKVQGAEARLHFSFRPLRRSDRPLT